jgi:hypothetical protein
MLDMQALEAAFARIGEIGKGEIEVEVDGSRVVLRTLTPEEDVEVQRFARGEGIDELDNITLIERFKRATLGYAIVQIGTLNLRGVSSIPTGESLDNGIPVRIPKHEAVRRIATKWSRHATTIVFQQYAELVKRVEDDANARVKFDTSTVDAEIERLESRLTDLRKMQAVATKVEGSSPSDLVEAEATLSQTAIHPAPRQRVLPTTAAPPPRAQPQPEPEVEQQPDPDVEQQTAFDNIRSSVGDFSLDDIAAEEQRLLEARALRARKSDEAMHATPLPSVPQGRTPPHLAARAVQEEVGGSLDAATAALPVGGVEAFRMPPVNLTDRGRSNTPPAPARSQRAPSVNQAPNAAPTNPNFRGGQNR